jgi:hypothetical protein
MCFTKERGEPPTAHAPRLQRISERMRAGRASNGSRTSAVSVHVLHQRAGRASNGSRTSAVSVHVLHQRAGRASNGSRTSGASVDFGDGAPPGLRFWRFWRFWRFFGAPRGLRRTSGASISERTRISAADSSSPRIGRLHNFLKTGFVPITSHRFQSRVRRVKRYYQAN